MLLEKKSEKYFQLFSKIFNQIFFDFGKNKNKIQKPADFSWL